MGSECCCYYIRSTDGLEGFYGQAQKGRKVGLGYSVGTGMACGERKRRDESD